jgi:hypothetical protein
VRKIKFLLVLLLVVAGNTALAIDPTDEDVSYLPQEMLQGLTSPRYGYDKAAHKKCVASNRKTAKTEADLGALSESCRIKATPRKCRQLSPLPPEKVSKSPQEICADACRSADQTSRGKGDCSLN